MTGWITTAVAATAVAGVATFGSALTAQTVQWAMDDGAQVAKIFATCAPSSIAHCTV